MRIQPAHICVLGLGYVGLPTAALLAAAGHRVTGVDVDPARVEAIGAGRMRLDEPGLRALVQAALGSGALTTALAPVDAEVYVVAVPTPLAPPRLEAPGDDPVCDLSAVDAAIDAVLEAISPGAMVILESTVPPGTTRALAARFAQADLEPGVDVFIAHAPERVLPGRVLAELTGNDRVVGGVTGECARRAAAFLRGIIDGEVVETDATTAELVKLAENTSRDVNIALANELAEVCEIAGADARTVIALANRHPRVQLLQPGAGVGGHCIPVDPWFLIQAAPEHTALARQARRTNDAVPERVVARIAAVMERLRGGLQGAGGLQRRRVALLGAAYKADVDDARHSPSAQLASRLLAAGAEVRVHDPHVEAFVTRLWTLDEALEGADAIVVAVAHTAYRELDPASLGSAVGGRGAEIVFDLAGALDPRQWRRAGFTYVGRGLA